MSSPADLSGLRAHRIVGANGDPNGGKAGSFFGRALALRTAANGLNGGEKANDNTTRNIACFKNGTSKKTYQKCNCIADFLPIA